MSATTGSLASVGLHSGMFLQDVGIGVDGRRTRARLASKAKLAKDAVALRDGPRIRYLRVVTLSSSGANRQGTAIKIVTWLKACECPL
jgi:hypothetical protein